MLLALLVGILAYSAYTQKQIYQESTANLLSTYGQSAKTFTMFAQRNWNILNDWDSYLGTLAERGEQEGQWQEYIAQKATWQYTDFYLFNEQCEFWTTAGRQGTAEHMRATFEELYTANAPVISSYISSQGIRKIMFAMPMEQPLQLGDTTYTALAVSYDNAVLEKLLGSMVYEGQSDCYIVRSNGDVVLSTETKTEITEQMTNLFDYLRQNASVDQPYFDTMVQTLPQGGEGCVLFTMNGQKYYLIYQPLGILDWSIIGIVPTGVVDSGMRRVQNATILVIALLGLLIMAGVVKIQRDAERNRRRELERRREKSDMMFAGMARVVERFAVCDLDRDRYQYHERRGEPLYQPEGSYQQMLEQISRKYVVLTDSENAKIPQMLAPENLRRLIKTDNDSLKLEYAARDKSAFFMMTVVPMAWKENRLTRVMMIVQDMGKQHLLQSLANTDGLNVRQEPNTSSEIVTQVGQGEEMEYVETGADGWVKISIDGEDAYVSQEFVTVEEKLDTAITMTELLYGQGVSDVRVDLVEYAKQFVGNPYVWGGTSLTKGADCSGFVLAVFKKYGIALSHSSRAQANEGTKISASDLKPGDLIFYGNGKGNINHVAIYIGGGQVIHASSPKTGIKISSYKYRTPVKCVRVIQD